MGKHTSRGGFTLIELIIYIGIFSIAAGLLTGVLTTFTRVQLRESATTAVSQEAQFVIQTIQRLVTDASLIELAKDSATSTLKLRMPVAANDPTCIQFSNGTVYLMQGNPTLDPAQRQNCLATSTSQAKTLTTNKVVVNTLTFKKFENPPATDTVKVDLTISHNSTNPQESAISRTLQTAIAKVSAATFDSDIIPSADTQYDVGIGGNRWRDGIFSRNLTVDTNTLYVDAANDRVGIGTTGPLAPLDVAGGAAGDRTLLYLGEPGDHTYGFVFRNSNTDGVLKLYSLAASVQSTNPVMSWSRPTGNVGIGTAGPSAKLHVYGTGGQNVYVESSQDAVAATRYYNSISTNPLYVGVEPSGGANLAAGTSGNAGVIHRAGAYSLQFATNNAVAMTINSSGNVGIGTTGPGSKLHLGGVSPVLTMGESGTPGIRSYNTTSGGIYFETPAANDIKIRTHDTDNVLVIKNSGNVGIGTASVTSKLQVAGGDVGLGDATATGNQPVTVWLTNGSGVQRVAGEIVIIGGSDNSFTTTTTANNFQVLGVVYDTTIAIGAVGRVAIGGVVSVLSQGAVTRGNYLVTSTTAGKATHATSLASGQSALGRWLESLGGASTGRALIRY